MQRTYSPYYVPRTKKELINNILPKWKGSKTELREYSIQRLRAVFHRMRNELYLGFMRVEKIKEIG